MKRMNSQDQLQVNLRFPLFSSIFFNIGDPQLNNWAHPRGLGFKVDVVVQVVHSTWYQQQQPLPLVSQVYCPVISEQCISFRFVVVSCDWLLNWMLFEWMHMSVYECMNEYRPANDFDFELSPRFNYPQLTLIVANWCLAWALTVGNLYCQAKTAGQVLDQSFGQPPGLYSCWQINLF